MTQVIACIDGTSITPTVCDYAAWASLRLDAPLLFLHVLDKSGFPTESNLSGNIGLGSQETLLTDLSALDEKRAKLALEQGRLMLEAARERAIKDGVTNPLSRQRHDDLVNALHDMEEETRLLVMGKHEEHLGEHLGSRLENVVRTQHRPILVTTATYKEPAHVLIAFDGSATTKKGIEMVARSPLFKGLEVHVVMVGPDSVKAQEQLDWARTTLLNAEHDVSASLLSGEVEQVLSEYHQKHDIDMIVMGAYGHSVIRRFFVGSTTTSLIRNATVPVLLLR